jgi:DNA (cytosine-5)-methyltransferase 3A
VEAERLQTLPDNYTAGVSEWKRKHALGNGWTVSVVKHILKALFRNKMESQAGIVMLKTKSKNKK